MTPPRPRSRSTGPLGAPRVAVGAAILALAALALLHVVRPDLEPPSHMISEYAIGAYGWLMTVCFAAFSTSSASAFIASAPHATTLVARVGRGFLLVAAIGLAMGAAFPTDPASTAPDAMSFAGRMHGVSFMIGVPGQLLAVSLLTVALRKASLTAFAVVLWLSLAVMVVALVIASPQPGTPVQGWFGIPNRTFMVTYAVWLIIAAVMEPRCLPG